MRTSILLLLFDSQVQIEAIQVFLQEACTYSVLCDGKRSVVVGVEAFVYVESGLQKRIGDGVEEVIIGHIFFNVIYMYYLLTILVKLRVIWNELWLKVVEILRFVDYIKELSNF